MRALSHFFAPLFGLGPAGPTWSSGEGTPEGVLTAPVGSMYSRTDGATGTTIYRKESGSGNSGWVPISSSGSTTTTIIQQTNTTDFKDSVVVASTANITLSGEQTIDGVLTALSRVLVKNQTLPAQNGIYLSGPGAWARAEDMDESSEVTSGLLTLCETGDTQSNTLFTLTTADPIILGTTGLVFDSIALPSNPEIVKSVNGTAYTILITDPNKWIQGTRNSAQTFTVPTHASVKIPVNSVIFIQFYNGSSPGITLSPQSGAVTIDAPDGLVLSEYGAVGRLKKTATNKWSFTIAGQASAGGSQSISFVIDGGGLAISTGIKGDLEVPFDCTIDQVTALADQTGSIVVDIWKDTYANYPPTDADSITAAAPVTISGTNKSQDATLTGWITTITAGDILRYNVDSCTAITRVTLALRVQR